MGALYIRPGRFEDLDALTQSLGQGSFFADRLGRQSRDLGILLVAWMGGRPVGDAYLWLEPAEELEIRTHLPGIPLLTHVEVHPEHRGTGIGTSLVRFAETVLAERAYDLVALAVDVTKPAVATWYGRLGYVEWPHSAVTCYAHSDGNGHRRTEICWVLVKSLPRRSPRAE